MKLIQIAQAETDQAPAATAPVPAPDAPAPAAPPAPAPAAPPAPAPTAPPALAPDAPSPPAPAAPPAPPAPSLGVQAPDAGAPPAPPAPDMLTQMAPLLFITMIVYFIVLRPQSRRAKEQKEALKNVRRGDTIVTSGGLIGKVTKAVDDVEVEVELAQNIRVRVLRQAISDVRAKGEPVKDQAGAAGR